MLAQKLLNVIKFSKNKITQPSRNWSLSISTLQEKDSIPTQNNESKNDNIPYTSFNFDLIKLKDYFYSDITFNKEGLKRYMMRKNKKFNIDYQKHDNLREEILGPDLSVAYFIIYEGGKVKFYGNDNWIQLNMNNLRENLPNVFNPEFILEEIDISDIKLYYEGFENFRNVSKIRRAILKGNPLLNDWCLDKISSSFLKVNYLDISECPNISERGLVALYKLIDLQDLILTSYKKTTAFELTCLMLEDCIPGLTIHFVEPKKKELIK